MFGAGPWRASWSSSASRPRVVVLSQCDNYRIGEHYGRSEGAGPIPSRDGGTSHPRGEAKVRARDSKYTSRLGPGDLACRPVRHARAAGRAGARDGAVGRRQGRRPPGRTPEGLRHHPPRRERAEADERGGESDLTARAQRGAGRRGERMSEARDVTGCNGVIVRTIDDVLLAAGTAYHLALQAASTHHRRAAHLYVTNTEIGFGGVL